MPPLRGSRARAAVNSATAPWWSPAAARARPRSKQLAPSTARAGSRPVSRALSLRASLRAYDPLDPVVKHEPYPYYVALRRDEPVKWLPTLGAFGVARYDDIDALLKDGRTFRR